MHYSVAQYYYSRQGGIKIATVCLSFRPSVLPSVRLSVHLLAGLCWYYSSDYSEKHSTVRGSMSLRSLSVFSFIYVIVGIQKSLTIQIGPLTFYWKVLTFPNWSRYALSKFLFTFDCFCYITKNTILPVQGYC